MVTLNHYVDPANIDWIEDCKTWRGETLTGKYTHWCWEWDGLPIDETCGEWNTCIHVGCKTQMDEYFNELVDIAIHSED